MNPEAVSVLNPLGLILTLSMSVLLLIVPRRMALLPIIIVTCYMTFGQQIVVASLHFTMLRVLVLAGCARVLIRGEGRSAKWGRLDKWMFAWVVSSIVTYTLLWGSVDALVNRLGVAYDALGLYLVFRCLTRDADDVKRYCKMFAVALVPLALFMTFEKMTGRNPFFIFGGVPQFTAIREGVLRCQGPFGHPILAGCFGAAWLPLFVGLWWQGRPHRAYAILGLISCTLITFLSGSSGPVATFASGMLALSMWPIRRYMRVVRWSIVLGLITMHLVMKAPVWYVFARIDIFSGSTGWHRSNLIDKTISNFSDWWLVGTRDTMKWGVWAGDITNQFILQGVRGGLITFVLFIAIVACAFSLVGRALKETANAPLRQRRFLWAIGCTLFAHVMSFLSVSYFDQNVVNWYLLLAVIAISARLADTQEQPTEKEPIRDEVEALPGEDVYAHSIQDDLAISRAERRPDYFSEILIGA